MEAGERTHGTSTWFRIPVFTHINHAVDHLALDLSADRSEDHLAHAACRALGALQRRINDELVDLDPVLTLYNPNCGICTGPGHVCQDCKRTPLAHRYTICANCRDNE